LSRVPERRRRVRRALPATACVLAAAMVAGWMAAEAQASPRPNIIVIQTDDQGPGMISSRVMPGLARLIRSHGTTFTDYVTSGPLCCPSRAVLLTGQYGHNNGVLWDNPNPYGDLVDKGNTLPVWLQRAGYRTAHLGKYLNLYARFVGDPNEVPPGWDEWHTILEPVDYYDYVLRENGKANHYGRAPQDYLTRVLNREAVDLIHRYVPQRRPLFMAIDQFAPHGSPSGWVKRCADTATPDPRDRRLFEHKPLPRPPSFNEADVSDKPRYVRAQPRLTDPEIRLLARKYRCRLASLRAVDRGIASMVRALRSEHELGRTAFLFTSDNGWLLGEHRAAGRKVDPYEESLSVPLVVRLPRGERPRHGAPRHLSTTVANVDLAPTILSLAQATACSTKRDCRILDGRSMLKAIRSHGRRWPAHRGILLELETRAGRAGPFTPCDYEGVRTARRVYIEYHSATRRERGPCVPLEEVENYDLRSDPFELHNLFPAPPGSDAAAAERSLTKRVARLRDCAGLEGRDPEPASGHYCE
jgi:N-acetylglucosamine-6-sulfatase